MRRPLILAARVQRPSPVKSFPTTNPCKAASVGGLFHFCSSSVYRPKRTRGCRSLEKEHSNEHEGHISPSHQDSRRVGCRGWVSIGQNHLKEHGAKEEQHHADQEETESGVRHPGRISARLQCPNSQLRVS